MTLACHDLTLAVPGRTLCRGLSLAIAPGEVWGVLGANGSGKTTLLHALAGLARTEISTVTLDGAALDTLDARSRASAVGVLMQHEEAEFHGSALEYVLLGRYARRQGRAVWASWAREDETGARAALELAGVGAFAQRSYATLSGGERQRVRIAQLIAQSPRHWLLDEPLQHLDLAHQAQAMALVTQLARGQQCAVVMVLHDLIWPSRVCTHALLMRGDSAIAGAARDVLTRENLEALYGCRLHAVDCGKDAAAFVPAI